MELAEDQGGERQLESFGSHAASGSNAVAGPSQLEKTYIEDDDTCDDDDEGADEKSDSPALYLRKFWRQVSAEPLTFSCFRSPKSEFGSISL